VARDNQLMSNRQHYRLTDKRPLSDEERILLEWLVVHGMLNVTRYAGTKPFRTVVSSRIAASGRHGSTKPVHASAALYDLTGGALCGENVR
jgi:hypothetical protein